MNQVIQMRKAIGSMVSKVATSLTTGRSVLTGTPDKLADAVADIFKVRRPEWVSLEDTQTWDQLNVQEVCLTEAEFLTNSELYGPVDNWNKDEDHQTVEILCSRQKSLRATVRKITCINHHSKILWECTYSRRAERSHLTIDPGEGTLPVWLATGIAEALLFSDNFELQR